VSPITTLTMVGLHDRLVAALLNGDEETAIQAVAMLRDSSSDDELAVTLRLLLKKNFEEMPCTVAHGSLIYDRFLRQQLLRELLQSKDAQRVQMRLDQVANLTLPPKRTRIGFADI
jgi:hypothetical protein